MSDPDGPDDPDDAPRVVVVGSLNVDLVTTMDRLPRPGETVAARDVVRLPGGKGANQALGAARAGAAVSMVGRVGDDADGAAYRHALETRGVDSGHVLVTPEASTGLALVMVENDGENSIVVVPGANHEVTVSDVNAAFPLIASAQVLVLQLELPLEVVVAAAQRAHSAGTRVLLNPSPLTELPSGLLRAADPLVVNEHEAAVILGRSGPEEHGESGDGGRLEQSLSAGSPSAVTSAMRRLREIGPRSVVLTLGAGGAVWSDAVQTVTVPAVSVPVVDTTGAGDAFAGALAAALASGKDPRQGLAAAVVAGAAAVGHIGAQPWTL